MKVHLKTLIFLFLCSGLTFPLGGQNQDVTYLLSEHIAADLEYSWSPAIGAVSYTVDIEHQTTHETDSQQTTGTSLTFTGLPSGTYDITVTATYADQSASIIIADEREL